MLRLEWLRVEGRVPGPYTLYVLMVDLFAERALKALILEDIRYQSLVLQGDLRTNGESSVSRQFAL